MENHNDGPTINAEKTLHDIVSGLLKEQEPEVFHSRGFQQTGFLWYGLSWAMDKSGQEVRRKIARAIAGFCNDAGLEDQIAMITFDRYATEAEKRQAKESGSFYCADLDMALNPAEIYESAMAKGHFYSAMRVAEGLGLGEDKVKAARAKYEEKAREEERNRTAAMMSRIEKELEDKDNCTALRLSSHYEELKRSGALKTNLGAKVACMYCSCILEDGERQAAIGNYDVSYYDNAIRVAEEAHLGPEWIKKAEAARPTLIQRAYAAIKKAFSMGYFKGERR